MSVILVNGKEEGISCDYCPRPACIINCFGEFLCEDCAKEWV